MKFAGGSEIVTPRPLVSQEERRMLLDQRFGERRSEHRSVCPERRLVNRRDGEGDFRNV